jgi:hypothetical protein
MLPLIVVISGVDAHLNFSASLTVDHQMGLSRVYADDNQEHVSSMRLLGEQRVVPL